MAGWRRLLAAIIVCPHQHDGHAVPPAALSRLAVVVGGLIGRGQDFSLEGHLDAEVADGGSSSLAHLRPTPVVDDDHGELGERRCVVLDGAVLAFRVVLGVVEEDVEGAERLSVDGETVAFDHLDRAAPPEAL